MNLQERLQALIGHDFVFINVFGDPTDEEGIPYSSVPRGRLREVGDGYFIIETKSVEDGGFVQELGGEWLVSIKWRLYTSCGSVVEWPHGNCSKSAQPTKSSVFPGTGSTQMGLIQLIGNHRCSGRHHHFHSTSQGRRLGKQQIRHCEARNG